MTGLEWFAAGALSLGSIIGGLLHVVLSPLSAGREYRRGVEDGRAEAEAGFESSQDAYERGVGDGRWLTETEHGWGPAVNAPNRPAGRVVRSPDFNLVTRVPEPERMPRAVFDY